jgi:hypothetical protein
LIGGIFVPWTTLSYLIVFPGGVVGLDWVWLGLGLVTLARTSAAATVTATASHDRR